MRAAFGTACVVAVVLSACAQSSRTPSDIAGLSGQRAMDYVKAQVAFGPRPPGSSQLQRCRDYIEQQMQGFGYRIEEDTFVAQTPYGPIKMQNLIARKGSGDKGVIALASHYDTKLMEGKNFLGANDGGSSTGLLIELARVLAANKDPLDYWFVFLDGEEAFVEWSTFDSTYGSRHLAKRWKAEGVVPKIRDFILLDMIGDKELDILYDTSSTKHLMDLVFETAKKIGLKSILSSYQSAMDDDHTPFLDVGIPCVDLIDFNYGPENSYWHTPADTLDKISPQSLEKTGKLVLAVLAELQKQ